MEGDVEASSVGGDGTAGTVAMLRQAVGFLKALRERMKAEVRGEEGGMQNDE